MNKPTNTRILLVDDEEDFLNNLSARLKVRGLRVNTATSGESALVKVKEHEFDVIVIDMSMPGMDGIETLRSIKQRYHDTEVIILTGHGSVKKGVNAIREGASDFLEKPIQINQLIKKISEAKKKRTLALQEQSLIEVRQLLNIRGW